MLKSESESRSTLAFDSDGRTTLDKEGASAENTGSEAVPPLWSAASVSILWICFGNGIAVSLGWHWNHDGHVVSAAGWQRVFSEISLQATSWLYVPRWEENALRSTITGSSPEERGSEASGLPERLPLMHMCCLICALHVSGVELVLTCVTANSVGPRPRQWSASHLLMGRAGTNLAADTSLYNNIDAY